MFKTEVNEFSHKIKSFNEKFLTNFEQNINKMLDPLDFKYKSVMISHGFPPNGNVPLRLTIDVAKIFDYSEGDKEKEFYYLLFKYYDHFRVKYLLKSWSNIDWLKRRVPLLEEAVFAHNNDLFFLSIPIFLSQLEGAIADGTGHVGKMNFSLVKDKLKSILVNQKLFKYDKEIEEFYIETVLNGFEHNQNIPVFSRHAILHGGDIEYGTKENSLKAIILFDYIIKKIEKESRGQTIVN
ncbi:hypothetical protein AU385_17955 [Bacillus halotolerans]|uniref:hypothetical protein n=1 Tax=Bacillus halotolerans TaxID=260554 RepID=UPI0007501D23|nr:hypothetical protein [Bacillus halotolerans]KUP30297.1 hypothetical protein AU385_17955 [Bacillus halotolerans]